MHDSHNSQTNASLSERLSPWQPKQLMSILNACVTGNDFPAPASCFATAPLHGLAAKPRLLRTPHALPQHLLLKTGSKATLVENAVTLSQHLLQKTGCKATLGGVPGHASQRKGKGLHSCTCLGGQLS
eukprot:1162083-Pelagomonas_calceolata.AAC.3